MQTTLIKIAAAVLILVALVVYIKILQYRNEALTNKVSLLTAINDGNAIELGRLRAAIELSEEITLAWEADKKALNELRRSQTTKLQRELQTNETFNDWSGQPVPDNIDGLLNFSNSD